MLFNAKLLEIADKLQTNAEHAEKTTDALMKLAEFCGKLRCFAKNGGKLPILFQKHTYVCECLTNVN